MPMTQATARPCALLLRIRWPASRAEARPGKTRAMMPITGSFKSADGHVRGSRSCGGDPNGRGVLPDLHLPLAAGSCLHRSVHEKTPGPTASPQITRAQLPGSGATLLILRAWLSWGKSAANRLRRMSSAAVPGIRGRAGAGGAWQWCLAVLRRSRPSVAVGGRWWQVPSGFSSVRRGGV